MYMYISYALYLKALHEHIPSLYYYFKGFSSFSYSTSSISHSFPLPSLPLPPLSLLLPLPPSPPPSPSPSLSSSLSLPFLSSPILRVTPLSIISCIRQHADMIRVLVWSRTNTYKIHNNKTLIIVK